MPSPTEQDRAARAGAASIVAPLGFLHPDGTPITRADSEAHYHRVCSDNYARSRRLKEIKRSELPDRFEYAELSAAASRGKLMARIWGGMAGLLKLIEEGDEE